MKLTQRSARVLAMAAMVLIMTCVVVLISTLVNFGIHDSFLFRFLRGWAIAFVLAFPLVLVLMPRLQNFFQGLVGK